MDKYKLVVSDDVAFDVRWTLNDKGIEREFGFRAEAKRTEEPGPKSGTVGEYLAGAARVRMTDWIGDPPIVDENGHAPGPGPSALAALYEVIEKLPGIVLARYLEAIGPKAKLGNSPG